MAICCEPKPTYPEPQSVRSPMAPQKEPSLGSTPAWKSARGQRLTSMSRRKSTSIANSTDRSRPSKTRGTRSIGARNAHALDPAPPCEQLSTLPQLASGLHRRQSRARKREAAGSIGREEHNDQLGPTWGYRRRSRGGRCVWLLRHDVGCRSADGHDGHVCTFGGVDDDGHDHDDVVAEQHGAARDRDRGSRPRLYEADRDRSADRAKRDARG